MSVRIITGDCREMLRSLPDASVHCVVTSPPYYGLRSYGVGFENGEIGLEASVGDHIATLVEVFREVKRVLRADGTCWINYGDAYASTVNGRSAADTKAAGNDDRTFRDKPFDTIKASGLKPKDLMGLPWRLAFALQADGWWLRQDIIWAKPNPMPESVTDRCTKAHEYLFLLSKSERYFYDAEAISETALRAGDIPGGGVKHSAEGVVPDRGKQHLDKLGRIEVGNTRNRRSVWTVATQPFSEAHFATFPPALIEPCILAGSPRGGTILDPFFGAGTTGLVADRLGRDCIGIELNPAYAAMAQGRIRGDLPMFAGVEAA